jgi:hypothetical protein
MSYIGIGIICLSNIICFYLGAKTGQKVVNKEPLEIPTIPKVIEKKKEERAIKREKQREEIILENIDNYDGTGIGQKAIPK